MPKQAQLGFKEFKAFTKIEHGGDLSKGHRKGARPVAIKRPMHLVLRASRATGKLSMLTPENNTRVQDIVFGKAKLYQVAIHQFANAGNHLHVIVQAKTRKGFQKFLRVVTGLIARVITGAKKADAKGKFWDQLAYTRVVNWGRDFANAVDYVFQNALEAFGVSTKRKLGWLVWKPELGYWVRE